MRRAPPPDPRCALAPLVVIDVRTRVARSGGGFLLAPPHLLGWERRHVRIPRGACVVLRGGLVAGGPAADDPTALGSPGLTADAVAWLLVRRQCIGVGADGPVALPAPTTPLADGPRVGPGPVVVRCDPVALAAVPSVGAWVSLACPVTAFLPESRPAVPAPRRRRTA